MHVCVRMYVFEAHLSGVYLLAKPHSLPVRLSCQYAFTNKSLSANAFNQFNLGGRQKWATSWSIQPISMVDRNTRSIPEGRLQVLVWKRNISTRHTPCLLVGTCTTDLRIRLVLHALKADVLEGEAQIALLIAKQSGKLRQALEENEEQYIHLNK